MQIERDTLYLSLIGEAISDIYRRFSDMDFSLFLMDRDEQALASFRLSIIGENANKLSAQLRSRHPQIPWGDMVAFRNIATGFQMSPYQPQGVSRVHGDGHIQKSTLHGEFTVIKEVA